MNWDLGRGHEAVMTSPLKGNAVPDSGRESPLSRGKWLLLCSWNGKGLGTGRTPAADTWGWSKGTG